MFKKLLGNLPFNPSLINQVSFYAQRLHKEEGLRRSGLVLVVLAMMMQLFAVISPPEPTLAGSANDIIHGGFSTKESAVDQCNNNTAGFRDILAHFGISCGNLNDSTTKSIRSTDHDRKLLSLGRVPYGKQGERAVGIGGNTFYLRYLWSWDTGAYSTYKVLSGRTDGGGTFYVLYDCGNVTIIEPNAVETPAPQKKANPQIVSKTTIPGMPAADSEVKPGDEIGYRIFIKNDGDAPATNVYVEDSTPRQTSFVIQGGGGADRFDYTDSPYPGHSQEPHVYWKYNTLPAGANGYYVDFTVKVNTGVNNGEKICNKAFIRSDQTAQKASNQICHIIKVNNPKKKPTPQVSVPEPYVEVPTKPCAASQSATDVKSCLELKKTARNVTQKIDDANGTTAAAGDSITYTLTTKNTGSISLKDHVIEENLADVMEYAEKVTDLDGGKLGDDHILRWPATTIGAGKTITKKITIKIKATIPQTPTPPSNPGSHDLMMTNVYGNTVNIKLPGSVAKAVEQATTTLPKTGPGASITVAALITAVASYYFARSRLMAKELDLVREEYASAGGA